MKLRETLGLEIAAAIDRWRESHPTVTAIEVLQALATVGDIVGCAYIKHEMPREKLQ